MINLLIFYHIRQLLSTNYKNYSSSCMSKTNYVYWDYDNTSMIYIKVWPSSSKKNCVICLIKSPLKMMKNTFYFLLKALFVLKIFKFFVTTFRLCRKNDLIRKITLTSKFITSQPGLQTIAKHILPNISQSKGNQTMKFGQLMEYNKTNFFLEKICRKCGKETSSRPLFLL